MNGDTEKRIKVKYIGRNCYEFDHGDIVEAGFLKSGPIDKFYAIRSRDGEDYAFPRQLFEIVEDTDDNE